MCKKIILVGGGTGGHAFPLLNLAQYMKKNHPEITFHWIGEKESIESRLASDNSMQFSPIICGKLRRYFSFKTILLPFQVAVGILQSLRILFIESPISIFSKGGYVSIPVALAGWILRIPVYMHESDSRAGLANRIVARFARGIFCSFPEVKNTLPENKILGYGTLFPPLISEIQKEETPLNMQTQVLVSCGSQGSASIFESLITSLQMGALDGVDFHVILGTQNIDFRDKFLIFPNVTTYDFFYDQSEYFRLVKKCDIALARSGSSIFEFEAFGLQMILIPHPFTGNNHQYWNAKAFESKGHELLPQSEMNEKLLPLLEKYNNFKKDSKQGMVDMTIFDTITENFLK